MGAQNTKLMKSLRGEPVDSVPFWEVWFAPENMNRLMEQIMGGPVVTLDDQVTLARKMGWEYLKINAPCKHPGASCETSSDGKSHYVQHGKVPLEELYAQPELDYAAIAEEISPAINCAHEEGMAAIVYLPWCFHAANTALGLEYLSFLVYDEPEYIDALFEWVEEGNRKMIQEVLIPQGIDILLLDGDCAYKTGLMINPRMFRELVFDRTKKTVAPLRDAGIIHTIHSDGKLDDLVPLLIDLGFSGVHGVEAQANDLADMKQRFGSDITLIGNMDTDFLTHANVDDVRRATEHMLSVGMQGERYIAACNTSPLDYIPCENYMAMVDVIKNFC